MAVPFERATTMPWRSRKRPAPTPPATERPVTVVSASRRHGQLSGSGTGKYWLWGKKSSVTKGARVSISRVFPSIKLGCRAPAGRRESF